MGKQSPENEGSATGLKKSLRSAIGWIELRSEMRQERRVSLKVKNHTSNLFLPKETRNIKLNEPALAATGGQNIRNSSLYDPVQLYTKVNRKCLMSWCTVTSVHRQNCNAMRQWFSNSAIACKILSAKNILK